MLPTANELAEIDRRTAIEVMGWHPRTAFGAPAYLVVTPGNPPCEMVRTFVDWRPTESIAHAWEVVERLRGIERRVIVWSTRDGRWHALVADGGFIEDEQVDVSDMDGALGHGESAPLAICRAAIAAVSAATARR